MGQLFHAVGGWSWQCRRLRRRREHELVGRLLVFQAVVVRLPRVPLRLRAVRLSRSTLTGIYPMNVDFGERGGPLTDPMFRAEASADATSRRRAEPARYSSEASVRRV